MERATAFLRRSSYHPVVPECSTRLEHIIRRSSSYPLWAQSVSSSVSSFGATRTRCHLSSSSNNHSQQLVSRAGTLREVQFHDECGKWPANTGSDFEAVNGEATQLIVAAPLRRISTMALAVLEMQSLGPSLRPFILIFLLRDRDRAAGPGHINVLYHTRLEIIRLVFIRGSAFADQHLHS